jgi:hypothetical protein
MWLYKRAWDVINELMVALLYAPPPFNSQHINRRLGQLITLLSGETDYMGAGTKRYGIGKRREPTRYYGDGVNVYERFQQWWFKRVKWW